MDITTRSSFLPHDDSEVSPAFYHDQSRPEEVVRNG
jgi:hypothetical protein